MGITQLSRVIGDNAPGALKEQEIKNYFGRKVAIDASMSIYQFLIAVRQEGNMLVNAEGETTSHLMGMFYRTIRMIDNGIKPVYVFDGKPPEMKSAELQKRHERREEAQKELTKAEEEENVENIDKFSRRLVKVTREHTEACQHLLKLMGVPYVVAPCEAEAQCAEMAREGLVYAAATEDMDALTFGSSVLLRHMTFSEARKMPIQEFRLDRVLTEMGLTMPEFIDLCILLGCDYCESIRGIGPKKAVELIGRHRSIEAILGKGGIDREKFPVPDAWAYQEARRLFVTPEVTAAADMPPLKWTEPEEAALVEFMCAKNGFSEDRIRSGIKKMQKARQTTTQGRIDSFFTLQPSAAAAGASGSPGAAAKRKSDAAAVSGKNKSGKKAKTAGGAGSAFKRGK